MRKTFCSLCILGATLFTGCRHYSVTLPDGSSFRATLLLSDVKLDDLTIDHQKGLFVLGHGESRDRGAEAIDSLSPSLLETLRLLGFPIP